MSRGVKILAQVKRKLRNVQLVTRDDEGHAVGYQARPAVGGQALCRIDDDSIERTLDMCEVLGDFFWCYAGTVPVNGEQTGLMGDGTCEKIISMR